MPEESPPSPTLDSLAAEITKLSGMLTDYMRTNGVPAPSFEVNSPEGYGDLPPDVFRARQLLLDALMDMWFLTWGPSGGVFAFAHTLLADATVLKILNRFDFWSAVPLDGSASYDEISERTNLPTDAVRRILQHALTFRFFAETSPGDPSSTRIMHTSLSAVPARSPGLRGGFQTIFDQSGGPTMFLDEALSKYSAGRSEMAQGLDKSAFALFNGSYDGGSGGSGDGGDGGRYTDFWRYLENDEGEGEGETKGHRQKEFSQYMNFVASLFGHENMLADCYDWNALGSATVVDVGGSGGHNGIPLAQRFPNLRVVVEDLPKVQDVFDAAAPADLREAGRVSFRGHDFFEPQPVRGADVYVFKKVLHDWPDADVSKILQAQVPALEPGARVLIIEHIVDRSGIDLDTGNDDTDTKAKAKTETTTKGPVPRSFQRLSTATDLRMMALYNARERSLRDFRRVLRDADPRFEIVNVRIMPKSELGVFEVVWRG